MRKNEVGVQDDSGVVRDTVAITSIQADQVKVHPHTAKASIANSSAPYFRDEVITTFKIHMMCVSLSPFVCKQLGSSRIRLSEANEALDPNGYRFKFECEQIVSPKRVQFSMLKIPLLTKNV